MQRSPAAVQSYCCWEEGQITLAISMNNRFDLVVDWARGSAWYWGNQSPNLRFPGPGRSWRSFGKRCQRWCLPWLTFQSMEYHFSIGTIAGLVLLKPKTDNSASLAARPTNKSWQLTARFSKSILLPRTTNGKCSGFLGLAWMRNSSRHESRFLNVFGAVVSKTRTQQSAPR